jgi:hypothetical protein
MEAISAFCIVMSLLISIQNAKHDFQEIPNRGFKWLARFTSNSFQIAFTSKIRLTLGWEHLTYAISINTYGQKNKTLNFIELYQKKK